MRQPRPGEHIPVERRFQLLVEAVTDYAIFMLDPEGYVTNWNSGAQRINGYRADEIIGQHFSRFYTEEDRKAGIPTRALQTAMEHGKFEAEGWRVRKDGGRFWASVLIDPVRDENGDLLGFAKVTRDLTERRENQRKLDVAREQLFHAQKMEAMGQLAGGIAHDFNNLLTVIGVGAELAEPLVQDNPKLARIMRNMRRAASHGESLTRKLLDLSRRQPSQPQRIDLRTFLQESAELLSRSLRGDIDLVRDFAPDLARVEVDPRQFDLALLNIALNARDAMPGGGKLRLAARNTTYRDPATGDFGPFVMIEIADTGTGMSDEVRKRAFEPFFTTKGTGLGTGLGLGQALAFATQAGGALSLESELGVGTTVRIYLPAKEPVAAVTQPSPEAHREPPPQRAAAPAAVDRPRRLGRILLVEDDPAVAELSVQLLESLGYEVIVAENAALAIERLRGGERVDLVFSDIMMPGGMTGDELARVIRDEFPGVFILLATGYAQAAARAAAEFPLIGKPYGREQISAKLGEILGAEA